MYQTDENLPHGRRSGRLPALLSLACMVIACGMLAGGSSGAVAQPASEFEARLAPAPRDTAMRRIITGHGSIEARLEGTTLTLVGKFEGLQGPATAARIHFGSAPAVRGPAAFSLAVTFATNGSISGSADLGDSGRALLEAGRVYVQLDSESAPDGNLWGWLLRSDR